MSNCKPDQELDPRLVKFFAEGLQYQFYAADGSDLDGTVKGAVDEFLSDSHRGRVSFGLWQSDVVHHIFEWAQHPTFISHNWTSHTHLTN